MLVLSIERNFLIFIELFG